jgi:hypothetical protein
VREVFHAAEGFAEVLVGEQRNRYALNHPRSGELILVSTPNSWQAYYWWRDDAQAPPFARTVDIHQKPGYDPVELHWDRATRSTPLDASLVRGSHGAPAVADDQRGLLLSSGCGVIGTSAVSDTDVAGMVLRQFGL